MILGVDISTYFEMLAAGAKYFDNGKEVDPLKIFKDQGVTHIRIRIWNDPYDENGNPYLAGTCDVDNFLKLGKLVSEKYGFKIIADFHYSDFWADPSKQFCPKAWTHLSFDEVKNELYKFTLDTLKKAKEMNLPIEYAQIGNETTNGMVFPFGQIRDEDYINCYKNVSELYKSGIKALKEVYPHALAIIHLENSCNQEKYKLYFDQLNLNKVPYDVIGMSYYPYWHGTPKALFENIEFCKKRFNKPVMIMELSYFFTLEDYRNIVDNHVGFTVNADEIKQRMPIEISKDGQVEYIKMMLKELKNHGVIGVNYWEPIWIPGKNICWASDASLKYIHETAVDTRNEWANQCLFDFNGNALPALKEFKIDD